MSAHPVHTPVIEADGALLWFDLAELVTAVPAGMRIEVIDAVAAEPWLVRLIGVEQARTALTDGKAEVTAPADLARLAFLLWARRWWPASATRGVAGLDAGLLALEAAAVTAAVDGIADGVLDGFEATPAELFDAAADRLLMAAHPVAADARQLCERLSRWFDDQDDLVRADASAALAAQLDLVAPTRRSYALAAGARPPAAGDGVLVSGRGSVDWALVPPGVLDAAEDTVDWRVVTAADGTRLHVEVAGALGEAALCAVLTADGREAAVARLSLADNEFSGSVRLDDAAVRLVASAAARVGVHVAKNGVRIADAAGTTREDRDAVVALVQSRAGLPRSSRTLAERAADEGLDEF